nr:hypothetical protein [Parageobacillus thermoglucosidasius]
MSGRQALVHLERWAHDIDLPMLTRSTGQTIFQLFWYVKVVLLELLDGQI